MHMMRLILSRYLHDVFGLARRVWSPARESPKQTARYCYSVWLRHLVKLFRSDVKQPHGVVMELGPGGSIGVGLAALLTGTQRYVACDIVRHMSLLDNLPLLDDLADLIATREPIPDDREFPELCPKLERYDFPYELLEESVIAESLDADWIARIRRAICNPDAPDSCITYLAPWNPADVRERGFVDLVLSQAVLEHVDDLETIYASIHGWLRRGGIASHQIDYRCHKTAPGWNGHWRYSDLVWRLMRGRRSYLINRAPHSRHMNLLNKHHYTIRTEQLVAGESNLARSSLAPRYRDLSDRDLTTQGACIQAQKR